MKKDPERGPRKKRDSRTPDYEDLYYKVSPYVVDRSIA